MMDDWKPASLERHYELVMDLGWGSLTAVTSAPIRTVGNEGLEDYTERLLRTHQKYYFIEGLRRLGLDSEPSDVRKAAKFHYLSNMVGGLEMGYAEESPDKVWVFYMSPSPLCNYGAGVAAFREEYWVSTIKGWHSHNGESLGNTGLAVVLTHSLFRGDPYDGLYFIDTHRTLKPEERYRVSWDETPPEHITLGNLDTEGWPLERRVKGLRNYVLGYIGGTIFHLTQTFGVQNAAAMVGHAYKTLLFQRIATLRDGLDIQPTEPFPAALMLKRFQQSLFEEIELVNQGDRVVVTQQTSRIQGVPEYREEGAPPFPPEIEDAITGAWVSLAKHVDPTVTMRQVASLAKGDGRIEWVFERNS